VTISESEEEIYELGMLDVGSFNSVVAVSSPARSKGYRSPNYNISTQDDGSVEVTQATPSESGEATGTEQPLETTMGNT
jgi:hypothetical protein